MPTFDVVQVMAITLQQRVDAATPEEARTKAQDIWAAELKRGEHVLRERDMTDDCRVLDKNGEELELDD